VIGFDPTTSGTLDNDRSSALAGKVVERSTFSGALPG